MIWTLITYICGVSAIGAGLTQIVKPKNVDQYNHIGLIALTWPITMPFVVGEALFKGLRRLVSRQEEKDSVNEEDKVENAEVSSLTTVPSPTSSRG